MTERAATSPAKAATRGPLVAWLTIAALFTVLGFASTSSGPPDREILYSYGFAIGSSATYAVLVAITLGLAAWLGRPLADTGLKRFRWRWIFIALGLIILVLVLGQILEPLLHAGEEQGLEPKVWRADRSTAFAVNAVVAATVVPFAEELFFRGLGVRVLVPFGAVLAIVVTALAFGLGHGLLVALPTLVPFGVALAWVRWRSDSVWPGMIAHGFYNGLALLVVYLTLA